MPGLYYPVGGESVRSTRFRHRFLSNTYAAISPEVLRKSDNTNHLDVIYEPLNALIIHFGPSKLPSPPRD